MAFLGSQVCKCVRLYCAHLYIVINFVSVSEWADMTKHFSFSFILTTMLTASLTFSSNVVEEVNKFK